MRFRRSILRKLAPLLSLSALMTAMAAAADQPTCPQPDARTLARLWRSVAEFVAPAVEHGTASHASVRPTRQSVLALTALADTPLSHSLWMLAHAAPEPAFARRPLLQPLRC